MIQNRLNRGRSKGSKEECSDEEMELRNTALGELRQRLIFGALKWVKGLESG